MLDGLFRKMIDPPLDAVGRGLARAGISANAVTSAGLVLGFLGAGAIAIQMPLAGLGLIILSRLMDGLDGAVARATEKTDFGGFFDIAADFLFYGLVPLGFVIADPAANGLAGAFLLASFYFNGTTFLGYAILAEKHKLTTAARGAKSLYFTGGLLEGSETIGFFVLLCLWPPIFEIASYLFGVGCFITGASRILLAWQVFGGSDQT